MALTRLSPEDLKRLVLNPGIIPSLCLFVNTAKYPITPKKIIRQFGHIWDITTGFCVFKVPKDLIAVQDRLLSRSFNSHYGAIILLGESVPDGLKDFVHFEYVPKEEEFQRSVIRQLDDDVVSYNDALAKWIDDIPFDLKLVHDVWIERPTKKFSAFVVSYIRKTDTFKVSVPTRRRTSTFTDKDLVVRIIQNAVENTEHPSVGFISAEAGIFPEYAEEEIFEKGHPWEFHNSAAELKERIRTWKKSVKAKLADC